VRSQKIYAFYLSSGEIKSTKTIRTQISQIFGRSAQLREEERTLLSLRWSVKPLVLQASKVEPSVELPLPQVVSALELKVTTTLSKI
jgi:hypothetical protein